MIFDTQYQELWERMSYTKVATQLPILKAITSQVINQINSGDMPKWLQAFDALPESIKTKPNWHTPAVTVEGLVSDGDILEQSLKRMIPWRKGPFHLFDTYIDSEWRSDMKWHRLQSCLPDLKYKTVLDVGCGNGYYLMKMASQQADLLLGIEPGLLQNVQFWSVNKYLQCQAAVLQLKMEHLPQQMGCFDVVLSMGVLYHRKSPIEHIEHLMQCLAPDGTLILETIVVEGDERTCLIPQGRYAQMRNVWFLPSVDMLCLWMSKLGFKEVEVVDFSVTTTEEQRRTDWMLFHSLSDFVDMELCRTIEGYELPCRLMIKCKR